MSASISTLPIWKKDSTPSEWLSEIVAMALEHPEYFEKVVVVYESSIDETTRTNQTRWQSYGSKSNTEIVGILDVAKSEVYDYMKGRRE